MQYISNEGLLIDTIKNEVKILGKTNTVEVSSGSFLGGNNTTKQNSISFGGRSTQTTDGSLSFGGSSSTASTSSIMLLGENNSSVTNSSIGIGIKATTINAVSSISIGGNNNTINKAVNSTQTGLGVINIGGLNNKIGSNSIVIGSSSVEIDNNSISIGGFENKNDSYSNVVFLNTRNTTALSANTLYVPRTYVMGDLLINGSLSASGTVTYIEPSVIMTQGYLEMTNVTNVKPVIYVNQTNNSSTNVSEAYYASKPKCIVNQYGVSINTTNSNSNHALTLSGSLSSSKGAILNDTLWFTNKTNGTITTNLYALSANILKTDAGFTMGGGLTSNYLSVIAVDSNVEGLRVTQTGSGPAFIVEDQASIDPSPFMILGDGKTGVGTRTPNEKLTVVGSISAATLLSDVGDIYSEGSVSIGLPAGTTSISEKLTVNGSISASGNLKLSEGTGSSKGILFGNDCKLYRNAANTLRTDGYLNVGSIDGGTTNNVVTHNQNILQTRLANIRIWDTAATFLSGSPTVTYLTKSTTSNTLGNSFLYEDSQNTYAEKTIVCKSAIGLDIRNNSHPQIILRDVSTDSNTIGNRWGMWVNPVPAANKTFIIGPHDTNGAGDIAISITRASSATNVVGGVGIKISDPQATLDVGGDVIIRGLVIGGEGSDDVVTTQIGKLGRRLINPRVWNTTATFLSGSPTTNKILKCTNLNTIGNSNISDNGATVSVDAGQFSVPIGTNALPGFIFNSGNNNGFSYNATNGIEANIGGSLKLRINTNYTHTNRLLVNTTSYENTSVILRTGQGMHILGGDTNIEGRLSVNDKMSCLEGLSVDSAQLTTRQGTAALPSYTFISDTNTGIFSPAADTVGISVAGTERFRVNSSGQLTSTSLGTAALPSYSFLNDMNTGIYSPAADTVGISVGGKEKFRANSSGVTSTGDVIMNTPDIGTNGTASELGWKLYASSGRVDHSLKEPYYFRHTACLNTPTASKQTFIQFRNASGGVCGSIVSTGFNGIGFAQGSDYRLKENPEEIKNSVEKLMKLKPKNFKWKSSESRTDGFYAHELSDICPDAVFGKYDGVDENNDPVYQQVDYSKLVPLLTAALQETIKELNDLKQKIK